MSGKPSEAVGGPKVRFEDAGEAGRALASRLSEDPIEGEAVVVVAVARGGVPVAAEVAERLGAPLDIILLRRLLVPRGMESQVCAASVCGRLFVDETLPPRPARAETPLDHFIADALRELAENERACRGARPPLELVGSSILLVDNGIRTGLTMLAALRALRASSPARVVVAVPVASEEGRARVGAEADGLVCLACPEPFGHVGLWYKDFARPEDGQIREMLERSARPRA